MMQRQFSQDPLSFGRQAEQDLSAVIPRTLTMDESAGFQPIHQFDGAVVANLHARSQLANARANSRRHALDRQHQLILAALQARALDDKFAEMEKAADLITKFRQRLVV